MAKHSYTEEQATELFQAISQGDVGSVKQMLETDPTLVSAQQGFFNATPLHEAVHKVECHSFSGQILS